MRIRVRLFAGPREIVGAASVHVDVAAGATAGDAFATLAHAHPSLLKWRDHLAVCVNRAAAKPETPLAEGDEVALLPPVSGGNADSAGRTGADGSRVARAPSVASDVSLSLDDIVAKLDTAGAGAVVTFLGIVRDASRGDAVAALEFEAWEERVEADLAEAIVEARRRFGLVDAVVHHRVGRVEAGAPIVAIAVASPHRKAAFAAADWLVDALKTVVPIWKKEVLADGRTRWVGDVDAGIPAKDAEKEAKP